MLSTENGVDRKNGRAENGTEEGRRERSDEVTGESRGILKGRKMLGGRRTVKENKLRTEDGRTENRRTENQWTRIQKNGRTEERKDGGTVGRGFNVCVAPLP